MNIIDTFTPNSSANIHATLTREADGTFTVHASWDKKGADGERWAYIYKRFTLAHWRAWQAAPSAGGYLFQTIVPEYGQKGTARKGTSARRAGRYAVAE